MAYIYVYIFITYFTQKLYHMNLAVFVLLARMIFFGFLIRHIMSPWRHLRGFSETTLVKMVHNWTEFTHGNVIRLPTLKVNLYLI